MNTAWKKNHSKIGLMVSMTSVCTHDVDGAEIPNNQQIMYKTLKIMGYTTGPQLVNAGFRNHQVWEDLSASHQLNHLLLSIHDVSIPCEQIEQNK